MSGSEAEMCSLISSSLWLLGAEWTDTGGRDLRLLRSVGVLSEPKETSSSCWGEDDRGEKSNNES